MSHRDAAGLIHRALIANSDPTQGGFIAGTQPDAQGRHGQSPEEDTMKPVSFAVAIACAGIPQIAQAQFVEPDVAVLYTLRAEHAGDQFGWVAEQIGDIDGDHAPDFVIGAPHSAAGGALAGRAYVYSGRTGALLHVVTGAANDQIGFAVQGPGDLDHDGVPDYAVGGPGGRVIALSGRDHHTLFDIRVAHEQFGFSIGAAGDVNHDGRPDLIVGAWSANAAAGKAYVLSGRDGSVLWTTNGPNPGAGLGQGVSGLDDLDHDGRPDVVASAPGAGPSFLGAAFVYSGRDGSVLRTLAPDPTAVNFGTFFTHDAGDVDRDGTRDILISDFADTEGGVATGKSYVFSGRTGARLWVFRGEAANDGFGEGRGVGDVDHDHHADLLLASYNSSAGATSAGKLYLYSGADGHVIRTMTGTVAGDQLGFDALAVGDVDHDHATDFLITGVDVAHVVAGTRRCDDHGHGHD